ncbi:DUF2000 family protein [Streptomyces nigra]|uniref:DUF2000 family protein n=1 Tax=Streptomyces nigra TaxID=1827580 RepID=UPI003644CBA2
MTIYVPTSEPVDERPHRLRGRLPVEQLVIAVDERLSREEVARAVAAVGLTAGARMADARGLELPDADQGVHCGVLMTRVDVRPATQAGLAALRAAAVRAGLGICESPAYAHTAVSDMDLALSMRRTHTPDVEYAALAVYGGRKSIEDVSSVLTPAD